MVAAGGTPRPALAERLGGALLGLAAGDALGATVEFCSAEEIRRRYGVHRDISGGGAFGWRPGQGTDDTDLAYAVAATYAGPGYTLVGVAAAFSAWFDGRPCDVGGTTAAALGELRRTGRPELSGHAVAERANSAGNGSLMRCLATGLARRDGRLRRIEAVEISAITHADRRCTQACVAYCDLASLLLDGVTPDHAVEEVLRSSAIGADVQLAIAGAGELIGAELDTRGYALATLQVGVWALLQRRSLEEVLIEVANLGGDADTTAAVAGGLLGARDGLGAIPARWADRLEHRDPMLALVPALLAVRRQPEPSAAGGPCCKES
ncbi:MAG: ADP-ribosylglycohydrolase family protein [Actinomycetota bacterium]|nr:ADP-ribosylglycohydrolase family protein [Actinomycetota bacterium]